MVSKTCRAGFQWWISDITSSFLDYIQPNKSSLLSLVKFAVCMLTSYHLGDISSVTSRLS
jgi:hypothetical protein